MSVTEIGRRLKKARLDAKMTQAEAARNLGVSFQTISSYERGINRVDSDTLMKLCAIYKTSVGELLRTPAWSKDMREEYERASEERKDRLIELWGCPDFLIERENQKREPDTSHHTKYNVKKTNIQVMCQKRTKFKIALDNVRYWNYYKCARFRYRTFVVFGGEPHEYSAA